MKSLVIALALTLFVPPVTEPAHAGGFATPWQEGHSFKTRMVLGSMPRNDGGNQLVAGIEIVPEPGWKTYWRNPGDAGGIPPNFDWSKSRNLKSAKVLYPAPKRFSDSIGTTIGYKHHVIFPVLIEPKDPAKPVGIALDAEYGICREICIPARAQLATEVTLADVASLPPALAEALSHVPIPIANDKPGKRPHIVFAKIQKGAKPALVFDVSYPGGTSKADLFVEPLGDLYLPVVMPLGKQSANQARYALDLSGDVTPDQIRGQRLRLTIVSEAASSELVLIVK
jgi:DsbC/DsbD-like thiol-disulfide interchange protein